MTDPNASLDNSRKNNTNTATDDSVTITLTDSAGNAVTTTLYDVAKATDVATNASNIASSAHQTLRSSYDIHSKKE